MLSEDNNALTFSPTLSAIGAAVKMLTDGIYAAPSYLQMGSKLYDVARSAMRQVVDISKGGVKGGTGKLHIVNDPNKGIKAIREPNRVPRKRNPNYSNRNNVKQNPGPKSFQTTAPGNEPNSKNASKEESKTNQPKRSKKSRK